MNDRLDPSLAPDLEPDGNTMAPLPGEAGIPNVAARPRASISRKGLLAVGLLLFGLIGVSAYSLQRFATSGEKAEDAAAKRVSDRPTAAAAEPRKLEMPPARAIAAVGAASDPGSIQANAGSPRIPALIPTADEVAEPIGVRRTGSGAAATPARRAAPEDAPVLLVSTRNAASPSAAARDRRMDPSQGSGRDADQDPLAATSRNLQDYQHQLQGLLETLSQTTALATGGGGASPAAGPPPPSGVGQPLGGLLPAAAQAATQATNGTGLFGGQLQGSGTPRVAATVLGNRSLILPKGTAFTCALKTKVVSATSGFVGCQVQRNVYSVDGRVLLVERGSHMDGEYRIVSVRPGTVRIPVLWTRIRTPHGVTVDIESPATGPLGESGLGGYVDNRWGERIGAAMLLSLIDDSVKLIIQNQANDSNASTVVLPGTTANTSKLAEKVLDSTINIPPLIYQNQGGIVGIYVARDVDFSSVYELAPSQR